MKFAKCIAIILFSWETASAQLSMSNGVPDNFLTSGNFLLDYLKDEKSADLVKFDMYAGIEESPFLTDKWAYARIKLFDDRVFDSILIKLNLFENKVHFKDKDEKERVVAVKVKEIEIRDQSSDFNKIVFVSGYGKDPNIFYQVISDGKKLGYIKEMKIIITEHKVFNAPVQKKFEIQQGRLCLYAKGVLYEESKNCSSLLSAFGSDSKIISFISSNDIKCKKEKDLKKLVDYYNSY
jgi:hypothetical protein